MADCQAPARVSAVRRTRRLRAAPCPAPVCDVHAAEPPVEPPRGGIKLAQLQRGSCRWPLGDPRSADLRFCGARTVAGGRPYCAAHGRLAGRSPLEAGP